MSLSRIYAIYIRQMFLLKSNPTRPAMVFFVVVAIATVVFGYNVLQIGVLPLAFMLILLIFGIGMGVAAALSSRLCQAYPGVLCF